jgi:hypothetical protein
MGSTTPWSEWTRTQAVNGKISLVFLVAAQSKPQLAPKPARPAQSLSRISISTPLRLSLGFGSNSDVSRRSRIVSRRRRLSPSPITARKPGQVTPGPEPSATTAPILRNLGFFPASGGSAQQIRAPIGSVFPRQRRAITLKCQWAEGDPRNNASPTGEPGYYTATVSLVREQDWTPGSVEFDSYILTNPRTVDVDSPSLRIGVEASDSTSDEAVTLDS